MSVIGPGVAAICTSALLRHGRSADDPAVAKSLKWIEKFHHDDGGYYSPDSPVKNYECSLVLVCLTDANADGRYARQIKDADKFLADESNRTGRDMTLIVERALEYFKTLKPSARDAELAKAFSEAA